MFLDAPRVEVGSTDELRGLVEGASVSLTCAVDANPPASILWYRDRYSLEKKINYT